MYTLVLSVVLTVHSVGTLGGVSMVASGSFSHTLPNVSTSEKTCNEIGNRLVEKIIQDHTRGIPAGNLGKSFSVQCFKPN
jgi:hypothetical protein